MNLLSYKPSFRFNLNSFNPNDNNNNKVQELGQHITTLYIYIYMNKFYLILFL